MKKTYLLIIITLLSLTIKAQGLIGAWEAVSMGSNGAQIRNVIIFGEGYKVFSSYDGATGKFIQTNGGAWTLNGTTLTEKVEFNSSNPELIGMEANFKIAVTANTFQTVGSDLKFTRIDNGQPGALQGAWLMSGRVADGKEQLRETSGPRKTMKILSGTRFQWIAYNTATKEFIGTGGGQYTTANGDYVEKIEFFSKDDSRVGMSLKFNYKLTDDKWHHIGFSSKGDAMHELWSIRK